MILWHPTVLACWQLKKLKQHSIIYFQIPLVANVATQFKVNLILLAIFPFELELRWQFFIFKSGYVDKLSFTNVCKLAKCIIIEMKNIGDMLIGKGVHLNTWSLQRG
jgi:hypothetical protein